MKKILAIDDVQDNLTTIKAVLTSFLPGCEVYTALLGEEGIATAKKEQPDTILLDIIMPEMDGYEVCRILKSDPETKNIPIIMLTALKTDSESRIKGLKNGADAFLSKPIDPTELSAQINVMLRIKSAEDQLRKEKIALEGIVQNQTNELSDNYRDLMQEASARKQMSKKFTELDKQHHEAQKVAHIGHWGFDPVDRTAAWSDEIFRIFGLDPKKGIPAFAELENYIHSDDRTDVNKAVADVITQGIPFGIDFRIAHDSGSIRWIRTIGTARENQQGKIVKIFGTVQDVTELKQAEEALKKSKEAMERTQGIAKLGGWSIDIKTMTPYLSKELIHLYELEPSHIPSIEEGIKYYAPEDRPKIEQAVQECIKTGKPYDLELRFITAKGNKRWVRAMGKADKENGTIVKLSGFLQDITEKKKAEEELRESEERLQSFMTSAIDGFMLFDSELNQVDLNEAALKMIQQKREDVIGKNMLQLAPDVKDSGRYDKYKEVIRTGKPVIFNDIIPQSKFGNKHVSLKAFKVGQGLGMIITDITEKIKSEQELKENEERIRLFTQNVPDFLVQIDRIGKINYINRTFEGIMEEDVIGSSVYSWIPKESSEKFKNKVEKVFRDGGSEIIEYPSIGAKGEPIWFASQIGPLEKSGIITQIIIVARDITERKKAEEALLKGEKKYRELVDLAQEGIWVIDKNSITSFVNPSMSRMLRYSSEEMIGKSLFDFMDEAGVKVANENIEHRKTGLKEQHDFEFICKDGDRIFCTMTTAPIMDKAGNYDGAIAGVIDITERKLGEDKIRIAEENRVRELNIPL